MSPFQTLACLAMSDTVVYGLANKQSPTVFPTTLFPNMGPIVRVDG